MSGLDTLLAWALVHVGAVYFVTESGIASPIRRLLTRGLAVSNPLISLIYCAGCSGFWLGLLAGALGLTILHEPWVDPATGWGDEPVWILCYPAARIVLTGFAGMGLGALWGESRRGIAMMYQLEQRPEPWVDPLEGEEEPHDHASTQEEGRKPVREPEATGSTSAPGVAGDDAEGPAVDRDADPPRR